MSDTDDRIVYDTNALTIGEVHGPAMVIMDQGEADAYFDAMVAHKMEKESLTRERGEWMCRRNLAYYAGYYDDATRERVERLFACQHPFLGAIAKGKPTPEEAFKMGLDAAFLPDNEKETTDADE